MDKMKEKYILITIIAYLIFIFPANSQIPTGADNGTQIDLFTGKVYLGGQLVQTTTDIDMQGYQLTLDGLTSTSNTAGTVGIGTNDAFAKLNVRGSNAVSANNGYYQVGATFYATEVDPLAHADYHIGTSIGASGGVASNIGSNVLVVCGANPSISQSNAGIFEDIVGYVLEGSSNYGGSFLNKITASEKDYSYGVRGEAINPLGYSYGTFGRAIHDSPYGVCTGATGIGDGGKNTTGVYGEAVNCGASCWAGYFNGAVYSSTGYTTSDANLKSNIEPITDPMNVINQLQPKSYVFNQVQNETMHLPDGTHFGMLAQDIETILPQLVKQGIQPEVDDSLGNVIHPEIDFKAVNYTEFIPFLVAAVKQMDSTNRALQSQLNDLRNIVEVCCSQIAARNSNQSNNKNDTQENKISVELSSENSIILLQNDPNPFAEQTQISYVIPNAVKKAEIIFYDNNGKILKTIVINERGNGTMQVYASNLSSGIYTYSLIADGKLVDTKQMVCNK